jgi:hypothetical protein
MGVHRNDRRSKCLGEQAESRPMVPQASTGKDGLRSDSGTCRGLAVMYFISDLTLLFQLVALASFAAVVVAVVNGGARGGPRSRASSRASRPQSEARTRRFLGPPGLRDLRQLVYQAATGALQLRGQQEQVFVGRLRARAASATRRFARAIVTRPSWCALKTRIKAVRCSGDIAAHLELPVLANSMQAATSANARAR